MCVMLPLQSMDLVEQLITSGCWGDLFEDARRHLPVFYEMVSAVERVPDAERADMLKHSMQILLDELRKARFHTRLQREQFRRPTSNRLQYIEIHGICCNGTWRLVLHDHACLWTKTNARKCGVLRIVMPCI